MLNIGDRLEITKLQDNKIRVTFHLNHKGRTYSTDIEYDTLEMQMKRDVQILTDIISGELTLKPDKDEVFTVTMTKTTG